MDSRRRSDTTTRRNAPNDLDEQGRRLFRSVQQHLAERELWDDALVADSTARLCRLLRTARVLRTAIGDEQLIATARSGCTIPEALKHALEIEREARLIGAELRLTPGPQRQAPRPFAQSGVTPRVPAGVGI